VEEHHRAARAYSLAARALAGKMRSAAAAEYKILRATANEARIKSAEARTALERHQAEHCC